MNTHPSLPELFQRISAAGLRWHGLYQGRTSVAGHTSPAAGHDPQTYGAADWNVRLSLPHRSGFMAYGGSTTLEGAILAALNDAQRLRDWNPVPATQRISRPPVTTSDLLDLLS